MFFNEGKWKEGTWIGRTLGNSIRVGVQNALKGYIKIARANCFKHPHFLIIDIRIKFQGKQKAINCINPVLSHNGRQ